MGKIIRAYQLCENDIFLKQGVEYIVVKKTDTKIQYRAFNGNTNLPQNFIGANSLERVKLIAVKRVPNKNEHLKKITQVWEQDGTFVGQYPSIKDAAEKLGIKPKYISEHKNSKSKLSKYKFKIID